MNKIYKNGFSTLELIETIIKDGAGSLISLKLLFIIGEYSRCDN